MAPLRIITIILIVLALGLAARYIDQPSPRQIAYETCYDCRMSETGVDELPETFTEATEHIADTKGGADEGTHGTPTRRSQLV